MPLVWVVLDAETPAQEVSGISKYSSDVEFCSEFFVPLFSYAKTRWGIHSRTLFCTFGGL